MNLSPSWGTYLATHGWESVHWSSIGSPKAADAEILGYARTKDWVVFTQDLDFGTILARSDATHPSVIQVRCPDPDPAVIGPILIRSLRQFLPELIAGALVIIDPNRQRARLLPIGVPPPS